MFQLIESRQILAKTEVTEGVDPTPTGAANALLSFEGSIEVEYDVLDRKVDRGFLGAYAKKLIGKRARLRYQIEMLGAAAVGATAPISPVLLAGGHAETLVAVTSATYNPISTAITSLQHYFYWGGLRFKVGGSRLNLSGTYMIDNRAYADVEVLGICEAATLSEQAIPAVTLTAFREPPVITEATWQVTVNGVTVECFELKWNMNSALELRHHSEARRVVIGQRGVEGSLVMDPLTLATLNPWALAEAATTVAIVSTITGGASFNFTHNFGQTQLLAPKLVERQRGLAWELAFSAPPSSAGNNDHSLVFT